NGSRQGEVQPVLGGNQVEIVSPWRLRGVELRSRNADPELRPGGRNYLKALGLSGYPAYVAENIASRPARTNGNPGGKLPRGDRASRSPARKYSAASRNPGEPGVGDLDLGLPNRCQANPRTRLSLVRRKRSERPLPAENGSRQRELQPVLGGNQVATGAREAFGSIEPSVGTWNRRHQDRRS